MKSSGFLLASLLTVLSLPGCDPYTSPDEITGPDPSPGPPPEYPQLPGPPQCTIGTFRADEAMFVTSQGGNIDLTLTVSSAPNAEWAFNVHAEITARSGDRIVGETSVSFDALRDGQSATQYVALTFSEVPGEVDCMLSWNDGGGNSYSIQAIADFSLMLSKARPA